MHQDFICYTDFSLSLKPIIFSRISHTRLTLLVEDAQTTRQFYVINPFEVAQTQFLPCKYPKDTDFTYRFRQSDKGFRIGDRIRYVRLQAGYSQSELAGLLGIDRATLLRLENNQIKDWNIKTPLLIRIAEICGFERTFCCDAYHIFIANDAGAQIKAYRKTHGLTQQGLAELLGVAKTTIKRWENNRDRPSPKRLVALFPELIV